MRVQIAMVAAVFVCAACGSKPKPGGGGDSDARTSFDSIEVEPAQTTLTVPLGTTAQQTYQVFGVIAGARTDITSTCALELAIEFGSAAGAVVTINPHGGKTVVTASCGAQTGTAQLAVNLTGTIVIGPGTPAGAAGTFGTATGAVDPARAPAIEYPLDKAVAPRNIPPAEIQWKAAGNDLFHIALTASYATIDVYTTDVQATMSVADWDAVVGTTAGGDLTIVVEGLLQAAPSIKFASAPIKVTVSHDTVDKSAIYYWASSAGNIMSQTFGETTPPAQVKDDCTSCHALSRSGSRLGYSRCVGNDCGQEYVGFMRYDPVAKAWTEPVNANNKAIHGSFTTFSPVGNPYPTDAQSLAIVTMAGGTLATYDPDTGTPVASNLTDVASHGTGAPRSALMADWSADGSKVVFTSTPHAGQWIDLNDGAIATMSYTYSGGQHVFGEPQFLVQQPITLPGGTYSNFFFPSFSADGKLIVFNAARATWRDFNVARAAGQRLMLAAADGSWVTDLTALNGGAVDNDITWPHWAPGATNDYYWIVFSSERDYGHEVTASHTAASCIRNGVSQCKQIWIAAIAKNKLGGATLVDPSAAPMWLPGQDSQTDNISPYWTLPVTEVQ
jgi:WD40-like Beta Propeller Repeat